MRIHAIDIVQPPGMGIWLIADIEAHQTIVDAALAANSSAEMSLSQNLVYLRAYFDDKQESDPEAT